MDLRSSDSVIFLFCALIVASMVYGLLPHSLRRFLLLFFSYGCYCFVSWQYALVLLAITIISYALALGLDRSKIETTRGRLLTLGLTCSLGLLAAFKYVPILFQTVVITGDPTRFSFIKQLVIPLGLSFYTFRIVSYLVDVYWGSYPAQRDFVAYAGYVAFFPQMISGPIQRADDFFKQVRHPSLPEPGWVLQGLMLIGLGCLKKVLADRLAVSIDGVFARPESFDGPVLLFATYSFAVQLYFDFSGITDIALGAGLLFGIQGPANFAGPFFSASVQEFWKRWHMSLTSWLRDYVYTPLVMSFRSWGTLAVVSALFWNMMLMGIWHDLAKRFLVFGLLHAVYMIVFALTPSLRRRLVRVPGWGLVSRVLTFHLVVLAFLFVRAAPFATTLAIVRGLLQPSLPLQVVWSVCDSLTQTGTGLSCLPGSALGVIVLVVVCHSLERGLIRLPKSVLFCYGFITLAMIAIFLFAQTAAVSFIYQAF